jgi:Domain of unknown function (DUF1937)./MazG nucleotide pyrophosphohydrolase domain.
MPTHGEHEHSIISTSKKLLKAPINIAKWYVKWANNLDSAGKDSSLVQERLQNHATIMLLHATLGLASEIGELNEAVKKYLFYGKELDRDNLLEEAGDLLWYMALLARWFGQENFDAIMQSNYNKLTTRYPDGVWTQDDALNRDKEGEMKALVQGSFKDQRDIPYIYLASPYKHDDQRVMNARYQLALQFTAFHVLNGGHVYSPIVHNHYINSLSLRVNSTPKHWDFWHSYDKNVLGRSDKLWVLRLPGWDKSEGVREETAFARRLGITVEYVDPLLLTDALTIGVTAEEAQTIWDDINRDEVPW